MCFRPLPRCYVCILFIHQLFQTKSGWVFLAQKVSAPRRSIIESLMCPFLPCTLLLQDMLQPEIHPTREVEGVSALGYQRQRFFLILSLCGTVLPGAFPFCLFFGPMLFSSFISFYASPSNSSTHTHTHIFARKHALARA